MSIATAVVGLGYWGPNLARNLASNPAFRLSALCDVITERLERFGAVYPAARRFDRFERMLDQATPELLVIATPVESHYPIALQAIAAGCHVLVEKPFVRSVAEGEEILRAAQARNRRVFVDHTFLFTASVAEIARQIRGGVLGDLLYVDSVRIALGLFQPDVDVIWDLAPHDVAILDHVIGRAPLTVRAFGASHNPRDLADVAYVSLDYGNGLLAHLHLSWLSPVKVRRMFFSGARQSLIWDDLEPADKIKIYDHGVAFEVRDAAVRNQMLVSYRKGDMRAPALAPSEALAIEIEEIGAVLRGDEKATASGESGLAVVRVLCAAEESLRCDGAPVGLEHSATSRR